MSDWVHIGEPAAKPLTYLQRRIMELMQQGKSFGQICGILLIRSDHLRDEIFEIRKYEALMGKGKLTNEQRAAIYDAWKGGITQAELAKQYGVSEQAISQLCKKMENGKAADVNQAFEDAVNKMIEEMHEMHAEPETAEPEEIEQVTEPVVMTDEHTAAPPDAVMDAVRDKIDELQKQVDERAAEIALLNEKIRSLNAWLTEVQA